MSAPRSVLRPCGSGSLRHGRGSGAPRARCALGARFSLALEKVSHGGAKCTKSAPSTNCRACRRPLPVTKSRTT
eukprot:8019179-Lingulodinium_polyedra.AAC.1